MNFETLDLRKEKVKKLAFSKGISEKSMQFVLVLDFSGSMEVLYRGGTVQDLVEKVLPVGMALDANQTIDVYIFDNGVTKVAECTMSNVNDFVNKKIWGKYTMGGTNYSPVFNRIVKDYGGDLHDHNSLVEKKSNWSSLIAGGINKISNKIASRDIVANTATGTDVKQFEHPVYVLMLTDGDCESGDKEKARKALINASYSGIFWEFIGIGHQSFSFLQELDTMDGRLIDNANFQKAEDIANMSDDKLYEVLMTEYPGWLPQAKQMKLIA